MQSLLIHTVLAIWGLVLTLCFCLKMTGLKRLDSANPLLHPKTQNVQ